MNIQPILIKAKKAVFSHQHGLFTGKIGEGFDFVELIEYDYTSDAKRIDWMAYAKTMQAYMKLYQEEQLRNIAIVPIVSGTLYFGYKKILWHVVLETTAMLAYSALALKDNLTITTTKNFDQKRATTLYEIDTILQTIAKEPIVAQKPQTDIDKLFYKLPQKHLVILLGDFLEPLSANLLPTKHEVVAIAFRPSPKFFNEEAIVVDNLTKNQKSVRFSPNTISYHQRKLIELQRKNLYAMKTKGIDWTILDETTDIFTKLQLFFGSR